MSSIAGNSVTASVAGKSLPLLKRSYEQTVKNNKISSNSTVVCDNDGTNSDNSNTSSNDSDSDISSDNDKKEEIVLKETKVKQNTFSRALEPFGCSTLANSIPELLDKASVLIAQRPINKHKRTVYMPTQSDSGGRCIVLKGPYRWPEQASLVAKSLFRWSVLCHIWNDVAVGEHYSLQLLGGGIHSADNGFDVDDNASRKPCAEWRAVRSTVGGESSVEQAFAVVDRKSQGVKPFHKWLQSVPQLRRLADEHTLRIVRIAFLHVLYRYIVGVGDLSMTNIIVNHRDELRGVDFEDDIVPPPQRIGVADRRTVLCMLLRGGACSHAAEATWNGAVRAAFVFCCQTEQATLIAALDSALDKWPLVIATAQTFAVDQLPECNTDEMRDRLLGLRDALADKRRFANEQDDLEPSSPPSTTKSLKKIN